MKKILILSFLFFNQLSFSQEKDLVESCIEQKNFTSDYIRVNEQLSIKIKRINNHSFQYFSLPSPGTDMFIGFKFSDNRKIKINSNNIKENFTGPNFDPVMGSIPYINEYGDLMTGNERRVSTYLLMSKDSTRYVFPLTKPIITNEFQRKINLSEFMQDFNMLFEGNNIKGPQKIKFYTIFIHNQVPKLSCSYFETQDFIYSFNTTPVYKQYREAPLLNSPAQKKEIDFLNLVNKAWQKITDKFYSLFL